MRLPVRLRRIASILASLIAATALVGADAETFAPDIQLQLGDLLFKEARFPEATLAYERARDLGEGTLKVRATLGLVKSLLRTAEFRRAQREAETLVALAPHNSEVVAVSADALWSAGAFDEAEDRYRAAISIDPSLPRAHHGMARSLATRSRFEDALGQALATVAADPREGEFHHTLGYVLERMRRYDEAIASYTNYLNLLPNKDRSEKALWTRQHIRFLESFDHRPPLALRPGTEEQVHTVPFRLIRDKVVVRAKINNSGPMDFVLDTGAEMTVVSKRTAQRHGIPVSGYTLSAGVGELGLRGLQVGRLDSLQIGTLRIDNVPTLIKNPPLRDLPTQESESFSPPALGLSVSVDYGKRLLTLGRTAPAFDADFELPLRVHRLAMVKGVVNDRPVSFVVDTGGEVISISRATLGRIDTLPLRRIPIRVYGTSGWDRDAFLLPGVNVAFDEVQLRNLPVVVLNLDAPSVLLGFEVGGIVGHRFLSRYEVALDLEKSVLRLRKL